MPNLSGLVFKLSRAVGVVLWASLLVACGDSRKERVPEAAQAVQQPLTAVVPPSGGGMILVAGSGVRGNADNSLPKLGTLNDPSAVLPMTNLHPTEPGQHIQVLKIADWGNNAIRYVGSRGLVTGWNWYPNLLVNSRAEVSTDGTIPHWTVLTGAWSATTSPCSSCGYAYDGNRFFAAAPTTNPRLYQDVNVSAYATRIDSGAQDFCLTGMLRSRDKPIPDAARIKIDAIDASGEYAVGGHGLFDTGHKYFTAGWRPIEAEWKAPIGTRIIRVNLVPKRNDCSTCSNDAYFDGLQLVAGKCHGMMLPQALATTPAEFVGFTLVKVPVAYVGARDLCYLNVNTAEYDCSSSYARLYVKSLALGTRRLYVASAVNGIGYVPIDDQGFPTGPFQQALDQRGAHLGFAEGISVAKQPGGIDVLATTVMGRDRVDLYACESNLNQCTRTHEIGSIPGFRDATSGLEGAAGFLHPTSVATGRFGDLFVADTGNHAIRRLARPFVITIGGTGAPGNAGNDGPALSAQLSEPSSVAVAPNGDIYFADRGNNQIRKIVCASNDICAQIERFNPALAGNAENRFLSTCDASPGYPTSDQNPCTVDQCNLVGVRHHALDGASCDDGNKCNGIDVCVRSHPQDPLATSTCVSQTPIVIQPDANPCTADYCDRTLGEVHPPLPAGTACSTGDACKSMGTCNGSGSCVGIRNLSVDDDNVCTNDSCNAQTGVSHTPVAGSVACGPASICSGGVCQQSGASLGLPAHDTAAPTAGFSVFSGLVASGAGVQIDPRRAALIRGRVATTADVALSNVTVSVPGRPEFGSVKTNSSGEFLFVVNGGGPLTVRFELTDYLTAERQVQPEWGGTVGVYSVFLLKPAASPTSITIGPGSSSILAFSPKVTETVGGTAVSHRTAVFFPAGTVASTGQTSIQFQATEYTVGPQGAQAMPADIAQNTVYTYASEFSIANGVEAVDFTKPVFAYVDNFLNLPAGTLVPSGFYDRIAHIWRAEASGCVVTILSNSGSAVTFDSSCDAHFSSLGTDYAVTANELQKLAQTTNPDYPSGYPVGKTLWRVPLLHFSPHDFNFGGRPPKCEKAAQPGVDCAAVSSSDCVCAGPKGSVSGFTEPTGGSCQLSGSIIDAETQTLGERLPLEGTPFTLSYRSDSVPGYASGRSVQIDFDGPTHSKLKEYRVRLGVAGQYREKSFPKSATGPQYMTWDGLDAAGRRVLGTHKAVVEVGAVYPVVATNGARFGELPAGTIVQVDGSDSRAQPREVVFWQKFYRELESRNAEGLGLGGWTIDAFHQYDPDNQVLYQGDGTRRVVNTGPVVSVAAGSGADGAPSADGTPAGQAVLSDFNDIAIAANGELYVALTSGIVQKVTSDGKIKRVAGVTSGSPAWQEGALATTMAVGAHGIAFGPDGTLYITDNTVGRNYLYRVDAAGKIYRVAGTGTATSAQCAAADGVPAITAPLCGPRTVTVGPDGSIYVESRNVTGVWSTIKRIEPGANTTGSGARMTTFMGVGSVGEIGANTRPIEVAVLGGCGSIRAEGSGSRARTRRDLIA